MKMYQYRMINTDTDAIFICREDGKPWSDGEGDLFLQHLNAQFPDLINFEDDGYFSKVIVVKAKNYIMKDAESGKLTIKGSSIKDQKKEPALLEMMKEFINEMLEGNNSEILVSIYNKYIKETQNVQDISRWATKKTISEKIIACSKPGDHRTNELVVWNAISHRDMNQEGDKIYLYPAILKEEVIDQGFTKTGKPKAPKIIQETGLKLVEQWNGDHDSEHLLKRCYDTVKIFSNIVDMDKFTNYSIKKNKEKLQEIL